MLEREKLRVQLAQLRAPPLPELVWAPPPATFASPPAMVASPPATVAPPPPATVAPPVAAGPTVRNVSRGPKVQRYSADGTTLLATYSGFLDATRDPSLLDQPPTAPAIRNAIDNGFTYKGFRWAALARDLPDDTVQEIGATAPRREAASGMVAALDIARTRIETVFADQKAVREHFRLNSSASVSVALTTNSQHGIGAEAAHLRRTQGHFMFYWRDCPTAMQDEYLSRCELPAPRAQPRAIAVAVTNVATGQTTIEPSLLHVVKMLRISRATAFKCIEQQYTLPSGYRLAFHNE